MITLKIGDIAPDIKCNDQNGIAFNLSQLIGQKVVLYFYPKDDTPGCTAQSCNLRDNHKALLDNGFVVIGVSVDNEKSHQKFIKKYDLPFLLLSDIDKKVVTDYGVWVNKKFMGKSYMGISRTTFIINEERRITKIIDDVDTKNHIDQIL